MNKIFLKNLTFLSSCLFLTVNLGVCFSIESGCVFLTVNMGVCF